MDLLLLHAPSVYDFRERAILYGPVSDVVPSSTVFEMYPLGFLTIASYLHDQGMEVLRLRCSRIDVFFMIGLPAQTLASVRDTVEYCGNRFQLGDKRLSCFISPMGPFIDPGSRGFEEPERFGYRLFAVTLEQHRQLLIKPTWDHILNYETRWMTRRELVDATYNAAERLNELKVEHGRLSKRIAEARALRSRLDIGIAQAMWERLPNRCRKKSGRFGISTVCDKRELFWPRWVFNFSISEIARILRNYFTRRSRRLVKADQLP